MASHNVAAELGQLARRRFGKAARLLYTSIAVEGVSVVISFGLLILSFRGDAGLVGGTLVVVMLVGAYYLRLSFQEVYDSAETMRRQSVLTEALGWPINSMATSEWMRKAGWNDTSHAIAQPLPDDYYATQHNIGGRRLAEMTAESAFYTRHLYGKVRPWLLGALLSAVSLVIVGFVTVSLRATSDHVDAVIAQTVYLLVPLVVSWDLFGWWRRVGVLATDIGGVERELDALDAYEVPTVLRIVMEYNCLLVTGFPVLDSMFFRWQGEIQRFWSIYEERHPQTQSGGCASRRSQSGNTEPSR